MAINDTTFPIDRIAPWVGVDDIVSGSGPDAGVLLPSVDRIVVAAGDDGTGVSAGNNRLLLDQEVAEGFCRPVGETEGLDRRGDTAEPVDRDRKIHALICLLAAGFVEHTQVSGITIAVTGNANGEIVDRQAATEG